MTRKKITAALVGNPNSGKTTVFNNLTGGRQHVGNYPGVTVEKKEGYRNLDNNEFAIIDLPGTYSLTAYSQEEVVTRNFIVNDKPDVVIDILDASNLERNLYLTVQLLELEHPLLLALNMVDVSEASGLRINDNKLSECLNGVPVVRTVGVRNEGTEGILHAAAQASGKQQAVGFKIDYGVHVEEAICKLEPLLLSLHNEVKFPARWLALKILENDSNVLESLSGLPNSAPIIEAGNKIRSEVSEKLGEDLELFIAGNRYQFVGKVYQQIADARSVAAMTTSDKIDKVLTNRLFGLPIFFALMWVVFNLVITVGKIPSDWIESGMGMFGKFVGSVMADGPLKSLIVDGIIGGVGGVLTFVPGLVLLFLAISILEDTGYMARAAFIMDRLMRRFGLHGKSFIPLLLGYGCSVPAIMGTRTLENPRDRILTILVAPFMSCSAKLPVYTVLIAAFFNPKVAGNVLFSIYVLGIVLLMIVANIFRKTIFKGESEPFVMELPPYRVPTIKSMVIHMWERTSLYFKKAGTIILAASILMWFLTNYPADVEYGRNYEALAQQAEESYTQQINEAVLVPLQIEDIEQNEELSSLISEIQDADKAFDESTDELEENSPEYAQFDAEKTEKMQQLEVNHPELYSSAIKYVELTNNLDEEKTYLENEKTGEKLEKSYAGQFGKTIEPVIKPLGFDWRVGVSLVAGLTAKEVVVSTMGTIYSLGETDENSKTLKKALAQDENLNPLVAYCMMIFVLIYPPCISAMAVIKRETNSWKWPAVTLVYGTTLAWIVTFIVYQGGKLLGFAS